MWTIRRFPAALAPAGPRSDRAPDHLPDRPCAVDEPAPGDAPLPRRGLGRDSTTTGRVVTGDYFGVALKNSLLFTLFSAPLVVVLGTAVGAVPAPRFPRREFRSARSCSCPGCFPARSARCCGSGSSIRAGGSSTGSSARCGLIDRSIPWLNDPDLAFLSIIVAYVWTQIPFAVVLVMAALSAINPETLEAATVDGANASAALLPASSSRRSRRSSSSSSSTTRLPPSRATTSSTP